MNTAEQKRALRRVLLEKRRAMSRDARTAADQRITESVCGSAAFQNAQTIFCFWSLPEEPDTAEIIACARACGKRVAFPRCAVSDRTMQFFLVDDDSQMQSGAYGIAEPSPSCPLAVPQSTDLCIVPALAADADGSRLGYGGGYYDRYLASHSMQSVCICYDIPRSEPLPADSWDVRTDAVIRF